ncbi:hypothetical protein FBU30_005535 [Linnemannia zychae]|nr:hypothetical protein FBU30_005535 [Linnemannia zychae]
MTLIYFLRSLLTGAFKGPNNRLKLLAALIVLATYKYRSHAIGTRRRKDLKEPKGTVPFFGHMFLMASVPNTMIHDFFLKNYRELGPVWSISLPGVGRMIEGDTPELLEHVLKTNFTSYEKGPRFNTIFGELFGKGLIASDGEEWKTQRKQTLHVFNIKVFREYSGNIFNQVAQKVVDQLEKAANLGTVIDMREMILAFTLDSFGNILIGEDFGCIDSIGKRTVPFAGAINYLVGVGADRIVDPLWWVREAFTSVGAKTRHNRNVLRQHIQTIMERRRKEKPSQRKDDLLMLYMEARDEEGQPLSDEFIVDTMLNFAIASRDTTAETMAWMVYLLIREGTDPAILKNVTQEIDDILGDDLPTFETHKKLKYAEACHLETLRLFPALPRNLRICVKDDVLPGGIKIHAGEWFTWSEYAMGRSTQLWGPDADEFNPMRWLGDQKSGSLYKHNPFSLGPRSCVGQTFAVLQTLTLLGVMLRRFEISLDDPKKEPKFDVGLTLPIAGGLPIRVAHRVQRNNVEI